MHMCRGGWRVRWLGPTWTSTPSRSSRTSACRRCSSTARTTSGRRPTRASRRGSEHRSARATPTCSSCDCRGPATSRRWAASSRSIVSHRSTSERSSSGSTASRGLARYDDAVTEAATAERQTTQQEPDWKRRFRAPRVMFPSWARDDAERLVYLSNAGGKFEVYTWDRRTGEQRRLTDRSEGTGYRVPSRLETDGKPVWWFDDAKGNEL